MRARSSILAAAAALAACATPPTVRPGAADPAIVRIERGYVAARAVAMLFLPWLPPRDAARLAMLGQAVERALAAARAATAPGAHAAALSRAAAATVAYRHAAGQ